MHNENQSNDWVQMPQPSVCWPRIGWTKHCGLVGTYNNWRCPEIHGIVAIRLAFTGDTRFASIKCSVSLIHGRPNVNERHWPCSCHKTCGCMSIWQATLWSSLPSHDHGRVACPAARTMTMDALLVQQPERPPRAHGQQQYSQQPELIHMIPKYVRVDRV